MIGKRAFIPFVTAGYPNLAMSERIILALAEAGAELIEVGIPFSDPVADGPVIQESSHYVLGQGYRIDDYLAMIGRVRKQSRVGLVFMTYLNPVIQYGFARLDREGAAAGLDGILISDLIPREYARFGRLRAKEEGTGDLPLFRQLKTVFLVAPNSSEERVAEACRAASGYIYLLSRTGVTGRQTALGQGLAGRLELIRKYTSLPVAVGFGIRSASQVEQVWEYAEGAIVGSAIVSFISEHLDDRDLDRKVFCYVKEALIPGC